MYQLWENVNNLLKKRACVPSSYLFCILSWVQPLKMSGNWGWKFDYLTRSRRSTAMLYNRTIYDLVSLSLPLSGLSHTDHVIYYSVISKSVWAWATVFHVPKKEMDWSHGSTPINIRNNIPGYLTILDWGQRGPDFCFFFGVDLSVLWSFDCYCTHILPGARTRSGWSVISLEHGDNEEGVHWWG